MDMTGLRDLLQPHIQDLGRLHTHTELPEVCQRLGLPPLAPDGSKRDRLVAAFKQTPDHVLPQVMEKFIDVRKPSAEVRNQLQDWLWTREPILEIPKKARHGIARTIPINDLFINSEKFDALLDRLWVLSDSSSFVLGTTLRDQIQQHVHLIRGSWSTEELFEKLGAFEAPHRRFAMFLEGLVSSNVQPDETTQRRLVDAANGCLRGHGVELRENGTDGGYPVFRLASTRAHLNRSPKNLIFASPTKPDLRFRDAVDNDIEIVSCAEKVLVYDRTIGPGGLRWSELQQWWAETQSITDETEAKKTLYRRLLGCLPDTSPPQRFLFETYYQSLGKAVPGLPALIPEVWLHWDPKTVQERGRDALFRFRMDFLLLLPQGVRVVLEVDGKHHYADSKGLADTKLYARMVEADRELKLSGYEVFRFGGSELQAGPDATERVKSFFRGLFKLYHVTTLG